MATFKYIINRSIMEYPVISLFSLLSHEDYQAKIQLQSVKLQSELCLCTTHQGGFHVAHRQALLETGVGHSHSVMVVCAGRRNNREQQCAP